MIQSLDQPAGRSEAADSQSMDVADSTAFPLEAFFDRQWAIAVVEQAIGTLHQEAAALGDAERFEILKRWLVAPAGHETAVEAARLLNMTDGAFKVAVHRLRKRFRDVVK